MSKTVCILLADGFEEVEAIMPADILKRLDINVILAGIKGTNICGSHGICLTTQTTINDISADDFDALILPGGLPGTTNLRDSENVISLVYHANEQNKICAAICAAPIVLRDAGITENKIITGYPGCERLSNNPDFKFSEKSVEISDNIITAKGMGKASEFGFAIARALGISDKQIKDISSSAFIDL